MAGVASSLFSGTRPNGLPPPPTRTWRSQPHRSRRRSHRRDRCAGITVIGPGSGTENRSCRTGTLSRHPRVGAPPLTNNRKRPLPPDSEGCHEDSDDVSPRSDDRHSRHRAEPFSKGRPVRHGSIDRLVYFAISEADSSFGWTRRAEEALILSREADAEALASYAGVRATAGTAATQRRVERDRPNYNLEQQNLELRIRIADLESILSALRRIKENEITRAEDESQSENGK